MWSTHTLEATPSLRRIGLLQRASPASYRAVIDGWRTDAGFRTWFNALLAGSDFAAFRWETPSVTELSVDQPFHFVLLDAPSRARAPEPSGLRGALTSVLVRGTTVTEARAASVAGRLPGLEIRFQGGPRESRGRR